MPTSLDSAHTFHYAVEGTVTPRELADSLLGLEGLVRQSTEFLKELLPELNIASADILITSVEIGSYKEYFIYRLVFGKGKEGEQKLEELRQKLGLKDMTTAKFVTLAILGVTAFGAYLYVGSKSDKGDVNIHIEHSFNTIAQQTNMTRDEVIALLQKAITNKEDLKKSIIKIAHPAGDTRSGAIIVDGQKEMSIPAEVTAAVPSKYEKEEQTETNRVFPELRMIIRAKDLDRADAGWFAIVGDVEEKRLPLTISSGLDAEKIPVGKYIYGDVTVWYKTDKRGKKKAARVELHKYQEQETDGPAKLSVADPAEPKDE